MADRTRGAIKRGASKGGGTAAATTDSNQDPNLLVNQSSSKKWQGWWTRIFWSWMMVFGFSAVITGGATYLYLFVIMIQIFCFREILTIAYKHSSVLKYGDGSDKKERSNGAKTPLFRSLNWYFCFCANYYFFGVPITKHFPVVFPRIAGPDFMPHLYAHHNLLSFLLYCIGFVGFVLTLQKGYYRFQFSQFGWTHLTLIIFTSASYFTCVNILEGLIWFLLPVFIIICNDCTAYIFGFFFGKTPLISLSPKKTWEGFLGAFVSTLVFVIFASKLFSAYDFFVCPSNGFSLTPLIYQNITCQKGTIFIPKEYSVFGKSFSLSPIQVHAFGMAVFGSLIAPFGGFFASGFKRAYGIKDFGDIVPGHGGFVDRFDCQFVMSVFIFVYYQSVISNGMTSMDFSILLESLPSMPLERQKAMFEILKKSLE